MKRYKKNDILEIVNTLKSANELIDINNYNDVEAQSLLSQCQELALLLGNHFEAMGNATEEVIHMLEEYCEYIYQLYISLEDKNACKKLHNKIQQLLISLINKIQYTMPEDKKEIVFFSYKASMWDSFESIWRAAKDDEMCEVVVVPIPYYDKKQNGELGEMHYEGDAYPDYVHITSWQEYNLEDRRPDIIYIHNPYDNCNLVTSVHPRFYARELKKYTNMLVYIPYFVVGEDQVPTHFCVLPGTLLADRVIVESEEHRKMYIKEIHKYERTNKYHNLFGNIEEKIIAIGSPKYDKVMNTKKEEVEILDEWKNIITKEDGSRKKVILYNVSITDFLANSERMLEKIEETINVLREKRDQITMLFRPHPLLQATISAMRTDLYERYIKVIDTFKKEKWGIYDDSADLYTSIALSDAYYGDGGSIINLFRKLNKPIMRQCISSNVYLSNIYFENLVIEEEVGWFSSACFNGLFRMNMDNFKTEYIGEFPGEAFTQQRLYGNVKRIGDKLIFAPLSAKRIAIFDIRTSSFKMIDIKEEKESNEFKFFSMATFGESAFILGGLYPAIIEVDTETYEITYHTECIKEIETNRVRNDRFFLRDPVIIENKFFAASLCADIVLEFNMESKVYRIHKINGSNNGYSSIAFDGDNFWLGTKKENYIVKWNREESEKIYLPKDYIGGEFSIANLFCCDKSIWLITGTGNRLMRINIDTDEIQIIDRINHKKSAYNYFAAYMYKNEMYFLTIPECKIIHYVEGKKINDTILSVYNQKYEIKVKEKQVNDILIKQKDTKTKKNKIFYENDIMSLNVFSDLICNKEKLAILYEDNFESTIIEEHVNYGEQIHRKIVEEMLDEEEGGKK